ncbi:MAG: hypothetical protein K9H49_05300 [Bacteroidales bacterium]|nr:hypothetical protein [Bacteroidales bacterium]MCF8391325.1 hypothetical protein [Bacteroidales bacterium]
MFKTFDSEDKINLGTIIIQQKYGLIILFLFWLLPASGQNIGIGFGVEAVAEDFFDNPSFPEEYKPSFIVEYSPPEAQFTISSGICYYFNLNYLGIPTNINFKIGEETKIRFPIGVSPFVRTNKKDYESSVGLIKNLGLGAEFKMADDFYFYTDLGINIIPVYSEYLNKWGGENTYDLRNEIVSFLSFGVRYDINGN